MFRSFARSLDRELGPARSAHGRAGAPARDSWLRDWPLMLGLVLSAALIGLSSTIGDSDARSTPMKRPAAQTPGSVVPGEAIDVGQSEAPADDAAARPPADDDAKPKKKRKKTQSSADPGSSEADSAAADTGAGTAGESTPSRGSDSTGARRSSGRSGRPGRSGGSGGSSGGTARPGRIVNVTGTSAAFTNGPLSYAFAAPTHTPTVGQSWRLSIGVKRSGAPLAGDVKIDILHNGTVVGHAASGKLKAGRFSHDFDWPDRSVGIPLTVKTTVVGGGFQQSFLFNVKVRSGS